MNFTTGETIANMNPKNGKDHRDIRGKGVIIGVVAAISLILGISELFSKDFLPAFIMIALGASAVVVAVMFFRSANRAKVFKENQYVALHRNLDLKYDLGDSYFASGITLAVTDKKRKFAVGYIDLFMHDGSEFKRIKVVISRKSGEPFLKSNLTNGFREEDVLRN